MRLPINRDKSTVRIATMGMMLCISLALSYVESLIPFNFGVPGIKLGLANLCTVILLYMFGPVDAITVSVLRVILAGFMFGNLQSIIFSLVGAILSFAVMVMIKRFDVFGIGGVSALGAIMHNVGQCIVAALIVSNYRVTYYMPFLLISGVITGTVIGYIAGLIIPILKKRGYRRG